MNCQQHSSQGAQGGNTHSTHTPIVSAITLTYKDWSALHCWPTAGFYLSDVYLCISCMIPFSSKLRHCSPYICLSCWFNLCCCPSKHSSANASLYITFHPCCHQMCFPIPSIYLYEVYCSIWSYCRSQHMVFLVSTYSTKGCLSGQTSEELQLPGMFE